MYYNRGARFPNGISGPWARWTGALARWESCWHSVAAVAAVRATWKFRLTFRPGNYFWSFQIGFWLIREISRFWDRGSTQNFEPDLSSRVVWPGEPFWKQIQNLTIWHLFAKITCSFIGKKTRKWFRRWPGEWRRRSLVGPGGGGGGGPPPPSTKSDVHIKFAFHLKKI